MAEYLIAVPVGYLLGSVPFGVIIGRVIGMGDVRDHGSGRTGMTNVLRTVGLRAAIIVLVLDMGKTILAVVLARVLFDSPGVEVAAALATIAGHNWSVFVGFKGGRGTSPGWGGLVILSPISGLLVAPLVGLPVLAIWRYMSLASILGAVSGASALMVLSVTNIGSVPLAYAWYGAIGVPMIVTSHHDNIRRLIRGEERKVGKQVGTTDASPKPGRSRDVRWPRSV